MVQTVMGKTPGPAVRVKTVAKNWTISHYILDLHTFTGKKVSFKNILYEAVKC